jgi:hypothetical protein
MRRPYEATFHPTSVESYSGNQESACRRRVGASTSDTSRFRLGGDSEEGRSRPNRCILADKDRTPSTTYAGCAHFAGESRRPPMLLPGRWRSSPRSCWRRMTCILSDRCHGFHRESPVLITRTMAKKTHRRIKYCSATRVLAEMSRISQGVWAIHGQLAPSQAKTVEEGGLAIFF